MDFNISKIVIKNILIYKIFNKESWDNETKKYSY